ncbi:IgGFc-binding protein [Garra rufa]|uniref:IgGFc-binding protein n=1 Tax=Garra rufa TaxID=137080 RepID=UPI003CCE56C2
MLAVLLTVLMFSPGLSMDSRGTSFITAFPENIASFYRKTFNRFKITTLHPDTTVTVTFKANGSSNCSGVLPGPSVWTLNLTKDVEEYQFVSSDKVFQITSDKNITVVSVSGWEGRLQSHVVQPDQNLGTVYHVPSLNYTKIAASFNLTTTGVKFLPFRLMIINAVDNDNRVTIKQVDERGQTQEETIQLGPYSLFQIQTNETVREIRADSKVAVILTHPCFDSQNCSCNMIQNQLQPFVSNDMPDKFPVPPLLIKQILVTTDKAFKVCQGDLSTCTAVSVQNSSDILPILPNLNKTSLISTSIHVSLRIVSPGLILDLIPVSKFAGCYLVDFNSSRSGALVIANTSGTEGVRMNDQPLPSHIKWSVLNGTEYSWTLVMGEKISTIWHLTGTIGVYMVEVLETNSTYGSAAPVISMDPDSQGCLVTPEMFVLGEEEMNWFMSRQYCMTNADRFARLCDKNSQDKMALNMTLEDPTEGWISLRRSLYSTNWYWRNEDSFPPNVDFTYWESGHPESPEKGLCASVSLDPDKDFKWKSARCCSKKKPVCYKGAKYLRQLQSVA